MNAAFIAEPPGAPVITGLPENQTLREGQDIELSCSSLDGLPKPKLAWYKGNTFITDGSEAQPMQLDVPTSISKTPLGSANPLPFPIQLSTPNSSPILQLKITASRSDNVGQYRWDSLDFYKTWKYSP